MMRQIGFFFIVVFLGVHVLHATESDTLSVTYIANEGFMLEAGGKTVLVDALFGKKDLGFCDVPPPDILRKMSGAKSPFDKVDLILVSHSHGDHFDADLVMEHLAKNSCCRMIGTPQAVERLKALKTYGKVKERIHAVMPIVGVRENLNLNGIDVSVLRLKHCTYFETDPATGKKRDRHRNAQNIGFVIKLGCHSIFHIGDSGMENAEEYQNFHLERENIDIAFLGSLFWQSFEPRFEIVNSFIKPRHIVLMHLDKGDKGKYFSLKKTYQKQLPPITIFEKPLEKKVFVGWRIRNPANQVVREGRIFTKSFQRIPSVYYTQGSTNHQKAKAFSDGRILIASMGEYVIVDKQGKIIKGPVPILEGYNIDQHSIDCVHLRDNMVMIPFAADKIGSNSYSDNFGGYVVVR